MLNTFAKRCSVITEMAVVKWCLVRTVLCTTSQLSSTNVAVIYAEPIRETLSCNYVNRVVNWCAVQPFLCIISQLQYSDIAVEHVDCIHRAHETNWSVR